MSRTPNHPDPTAEPANSSLRTPRDLAAPVLAFDLAGEAARLRTENPWNQHGRNAVTLVKHSDLRIVLMVMKTSARLEEHHTGARISVHTLSGHVRLHLAGGTVELPAGHLLALDKDIPHDLEASEESTVLLTIAWQEK